MANKELTLTQKKNRYRALQYTTFVGEFLSVLTPFIIMGAANADEWFYQEEGWKVGLGGALALALMGIAVFMVAKKKENEQKNNENEKISFGYIVLIIGWFALTFIFMLLASINEQITTIMLFGGFGLLGAFGLDITSKEFKSKADRLKANIEKAKDKVQEEEAKKEIDDKATKKVSIKVKEGNN